MADPEAAYITLQELKCPTTIVSYETTKSLGVAWVSYCHMKETLVSYDRIKMSWVNAKVSLKY